MPGLGRSWAFDEETDTGPTRGARWLRTPRSATEREPDARTGGEDE
jgi:hypothetical protein